MKQNLNCIIFPLRLTSKWSWSDRVCVRLGLCCARFPLIHTYWFDHMSQRSHLKCRLHPLEGLEVTVLIKLFFSSLTLSLSHSHSLLLFIRHPWGMLSADAHENKATERGKQQEEEFTKQHRISRRARRRSCVQTSSAVSLKKKKQDVTPVLN